MAQLLKWDKQTPDDFYSTKTHMWIMLDGKIRMSKKKSHLIHAHIWGEDAWNIEERGYYNDNYGIVSCHGKVSEELINKLAKKFSRAMYIKGSFE